MLLGCSLLLLLTGCGQTQLAASTLPLTATAAIPSTPTPNYPQYHTSADLNVFPPPTPVPTYPNFRATVETEVQLTRVARATAHALTPTLLPPTRPSITSTPAPLPLGIFPQDPQTHPCDCRLNSGWRGILNGEYVDVWAGAYTHGLEQGVLVVFTRTLGLHTGLETLYDTPTADGAVQITAADGSRLTLTTATNHQFIFDVATRRWVNP
jgi:hypothetical protein